MCSSCRNALEVHVLRNSSIVSRNMLYTESYIPFYIYIHYIGVVTLYRGNSSYLSTRVRVHKLRVVYDGTYLTTYLPHSL